MAKSFLHKAAESVARAAGHFVTVGEEGERHAIFVKGPAPEGMKRGGMPESVKRHLIKQGGGARSARYKRIGASTPEEQARVAKLRQHVAAHKRNLRAPGNSALRESTRARLGTAMDRKGMSSAERSAEAGKLRTLHRYKSEAAAKRSAEFAVKSGAHVEGKQPARAVPLRTQADAAKASRGLGFDERARMAGRLKREHAAKTESRQMGQVARANTIREAQGSFRERLAAKSTAKTEPSFSLRNFREPKKFESTGTGKTKPLFEEMRGAGAKELPGQTNFLGGRERPDTRMAPITKSDWRVTTESARTPPGITRERTAAKLKTLREQVQTAKRDPSSHTEHAPGTVTELQTKHVHFDPDRFQYKLAAQGQHGVTDALSGVKKYDPELGGVLQVWKDPANGKVFVVNGHHRLDLANKLGAERVAVRFIHATSAEEARATGAITNIAEGRGSSLDAAKFFRDTGLSREHLESRGVPMRERVATEGLALSNLHEPIFKRVVNGELTTARGAIIGSGLSHAQQTSVMKSLDRLPKGRVPSDATLRETVEHAKHAPTATKTTRGLFGDDEQEVSLSLHRGEIAAHVRDRLSREKKVFGTVARERNAADLARGGNTINTAESGKISQAASENLATFDLLKHRSGPVSKLLNEGAERAHKGEKMKAVREDIYRRLPAAIRETLAGR